MKYTFCTKEIIPDTVLIRVVERTVLLLMLSYALRYEETEIQSVHEEIVLAHLQTLKFKGLILSVKEGKNVTESFLYYLVMSIKLHYYKYDKRTYLICSLSCGLFCAKFHFMCLLYGYLHQPHPAVHLVLPLGWKSQLLPWPFPQQNFL